MQNLSAVRRALRKQARATRARLSHAARRASARALARRVTHDICFRKARNIACYLAVGSEIDTTALIARAWRLGKTIYLPRMRNDRENTLEFAPYRERTRLRRNRYGILEPRSRRRSLPPRRLDLFLLPLVGFDLSGTRLGSGAGYYDRSLASLARSRWKFTPLYGLAYERQRLISIPSAPWDIPLHGVYTDETCHRILPRPPMP